MLRVLHVIETIAPREGGPPRVVAGLARAQRDLGIEADVLCGDGRDLADYLEYWQAHAAGFAPDSVHAIGTGGQSLLARRAELHAWLRAHLARFDLVHVHHLWRLVPTVTANACRRSHIPYLIAPHTGLSPWALAQKRAKKSLARWLIWDRLLRSAAGFHALNELEAAEIRACIGAASSPISVVPNGVSLTEYPGGSTPAAPAPFENLLSSPEGAAPFVLFLARLHVMKGPDLLLEAFAEVAAAHPQLRLVYAGPDYGMLTQLRKGVSAHRLSDRVHFLGLVSGAERYWLLNNAVCLCQPSRDEGFSLSILEALACARPVVISDRCKFPQVATSGAGAVVTPSTSELSAALSSYVSDPARRARDGRRGRELIEASYNLEAVARLTEIMYVKAIAAAPQSRRPWASRPLQRPAKSQDNE
jgi:glycosyltransferase involved in cell wall biosynthesis